MDLVERWASLTSPVEPGTWTATRLSKMTRIARTDGDGAAILWEHAFDETLIGFGLRTSHVEYAPVRALAIRDGAELHRGTFAVLQCSHADSSFLGQFLRVINSLPLDVQGDDGLAQFDAAVRQLFELFRNLARPGSRTIQGAWAETLIVAHGHSPDLLVQAWHSDPMELHDFRSNDHRLEVKSSASGLREHEFSLEQVERFPQHTVVASVLMQEDELGWSIFDLLNNLSSRLSTPDLVRRAEVIVAESLGQGWRDAEEKRYDVASALASIQLYSAAQVPRVPGPIPAAVRGVRFRADLSNLVPSAFPLSHVATLLLPLVPYEEL